MNKIVILLPALALTLVACGEEPAPQPAATETAAAPAKPSLPPPDQETFSQAFAAACPDAEKISVAVCKRAGFTDEILCEYGLGDDPYLRNQATLIPGDGAWTLVDPETVCAAGAE